jgi:uncharacterized membrane protein
VQEARITTDGSGLGSSPHSLGPSLPAETLGAPFTPKVTGRIAFFFGPFAGALVSIINLRRMRYPEQASKAFSIALFGSLGLAIALFFIPDPFARFVGFGAEFVFYHIFKDLQEGVFTEWQAAHASVEPANGWLAIGWGILGLLLTLVLFLVVFIALGFFGLQPR